MVISVAISQLVQNLHELTHYVLPHFPGPLYQKALGRLQPFGVAISRKATASRVVFI
jgi:hypothetical protein